MQELNKKIIGNATAAYFMVFVSLCFLFSTNKNVNHPFVKNHVKSAFMLHLLMALLLFIMSHSFLDGIKIASYSVNTIITAGCALLIFGAILYGMHKAHSGKTVTLGEIFHTAGLPKTLMTTKSSESIQEHESIIMILSHIPFLGYAIGPKNMGLPHMRDILQLNFIATLIATLLFIAGHSSLANIIMLAYIIWSVLQAISLTSQGKLISINLDIVPTVEEKYILQKSLLSYISNTLRKNTFVPLSQIIEKNTLQRKNDEIANAKNIKTKYGYHLKNSMVLLILFFISILLFGLNNQIMLLFLFPLFYSFGHNENLAYKMPYIYDIHSCAANFMYKLTHIFSRAKQLKNTTKTQSVKIGEVKKES